MASSQPLSQARAALARGDFREVLDLTQIALAQHENDVELLGARYAAQAELGDLKAAIETLRRIIELQPDAIAAINDLALFLFMTGENGEADAFARHALRMAPLDPQAHNMLGMILSETSNLLAGEWHYRRAIELAGRQSKLIANLALNLMQQGRSEESEKAFAEAARLEPDNPATLVNWARLCEAQGDTKRAHEILDRAEKAAQAAGGDVSLARALVLSREKRYHDAIATLQAARKTGRETTLPPIKQLERGRLYDRLERFDEAWKDFMDAKARFRENRGLGYNTEMVEHYFKRLRFFFNRNHMEILPRAKTQEGAAQPVFILGFPRSGTTMIEQVLSSHSQVQAGDELPFIAELTRLAPRILASPYEFPEALSDTWAADRKFAIEMFRDYYLSRAEQLGLNKQGVYFFTDKQPLNETFLPFIHLIFPEARFVHLIRHPLDIAVSVMSNYLTHGFNCGFQLETFAHHYMAVYDLVKYHRAQENYAYLSLRYETFVQNQREETSKLLAFLGLPFEEACLMFHENPRYARTASYAQVTEKLYDRSIGRYRQYLSHLEPIIPTLRPAIAALGYEI